MRHVPTAAPSLTTTRSSTRITLTGVLSSEGRGKPPMMAPIVQLEAMTSSTWKGHTTWDAELRTMLIMLKPPMMAPIVSKSNEACLYYSHGSPPKGIDAACQRWRDHAPRRLAVGGQHRYLKKSNGWSPGMRLATPFAGTPRGAQLPPIKRWEGQRSNQAGRPSPATVPWSQKEQSALRGWEKRELLAQTHAPYPCVRLARGSHLLTGWWKK